MTLQQQIQALGTYEIIEHRFLPDIDSDSFVLRHKKTGARIGLLPNADNNKVFYVAFRTPPKDSTGVAHIIEHTVLCGSRDFPVKDPFVELVKGSLNTFLNAMTFPDKTMYPVASTNDKDFANLMHVYLDAVFYPNIYTEQNIFRQEGWHYEAMPNAKGELDTDSDITINGVVYNEMKGVMSSPDDVLGDKVLASLYPDTTYSIVSGGDPAFIPDLTYEAYLAFHQKYYHPSNSYIYLYGDMDMIERLTYLDEAYLSHFDRIEVDSEVTRQKAFAAPVEASFPYSIMQDEDPAGKAFLSVNYVLPDVPGDSRAQIKRDLAFKVIDYVLCDAEGAPVKEALRTKGIGEDVDSVFDDSIVQPFYSITAKYADEAQKEEFLQTVDEVLAREAKAGLDARSLAAGINYYEFHYREADFGSYPKGLVYGIDAMDLWLYSDAVSPWEGQNIGGLFDELKAAVGTGYFENLITECLLRNTHKSVVLLTPEQGLTERNDAALRDKMRAFTRTLSADEKRAIVEETKALKKWQETPDPKEAMETIPVLSREDLDKTSQAYVNDLKKTKSGLPVLTHPIFTSGIDYVTLVFDLASLPKEMIRYLGIFKTVLGVLNTEHYTYSELDHETNIVTGGIVPSIATYNAAKSTGENRDTYKLTFEVHMKAMHENLSDAMALLSEILLHTKYDDLARIRQVLEEERAGARQDLAASGHGTAVGRAMSYISETSALMDEINGLAAYRVLDEVCETFDTESEKLPGILSEIAAEIFKARNLLPDVTCDAAYMDEALEAFDNFAAALPDGASHQNDQVQGGKPAYRAHAYRPVLSRKNEGFTTAGQVQFVARAGNFEDHGFTYNGALRVLKVILGYDYLWQKIRVSGGAYGCMSGFAKDGCAYFVTYRDPHLARSVEVFEQAADYIRSFDADERTMTKYVIGAVSALDRPLSPKILGRYSLTGFLTGFSMEDMQKERNEVLGTKVEDIRTLGDLLSAFMQDECICVVGSREKIEAHKELFDTITPLV